MSSDYLEDVKDDKETVVLLTMRVGGFAELITMESDKIIEDTDVIETEGKIVTFRLIPDESGWRNATNIANALSAWVEHTKRINHETRTTNS